jgi:hypothetical protein
LRACNVQFGRIGSRWVIVPAFRIAEATIFFYRVRNSSAPLGWNGPFQEVREIVGFQNVYQRTDSVEDRQHAVTGNRSNASGVINMKQLLVSVRRQSAAITDQRMRVLVVIRTE